jgi:hypothetical protein
LVRNCWAMSYSSCCRPLTRKQSREDFWQRINHLWLYYADARSYKIADYWIYGVAKIGGVTMVVPIVRSSEKLLCLPSLPALRIIL